MSAATREEWAADAVIMVAERLLLHDVQVRYDVRVSFGDLGKNVVGQVCPAEWVADGAQEMMISMREDNPRVLLGTIAHECIHAAGVDGHYANFRRGAAMLGLVPAEGRKWTTAGFDAVKDVDLPDWAVSALDHLGPFPAPALVPVQRKVQRTRMLKVVCLRCGLTFRATAKHLHPFRADPTVARCVHPACDGALSIAWPEDADDG